MSRELKRVPLDFDWPLNKVWQGYLNPHYVNSEKCAACAGTGYSPQAKRMQEEWYGNAEPPFDPKAYGATPLTVEHPAIQDAARRNVEQSQEYYGSGPIAIQREARRLWGHWRSSWSHHLIKADVDALVKADRLFDFTRVPRDEKQRTDQAKKIADGGNSWLPYSNGYTPTADEVNDWSMRGMAHDSINSWVCIKARCKRERVPTTCKQCKGSGERWISPEAKRRANRWKPIEPPKGEGFQLWEDVSEGSPVSPVFATLDELCAWCETNATTFASFKTSAAEWKRMLEADFVVHKDERGNVFM